MFNNALILIAVIVLAMLSSGAMAYGLLFRRVNTEQATAKRINSFAARAPANTDRRAQSDATLKRKNIQESIKEFEAKQKDSLKKKRSVPLSQRMSQAGMNWTKRGFYIFSAVSGVIFGVVGFLLSGVPLVALGLAVTGAFGFPRWFINFRLKRRIAQFLHELPNAVDVIIRGIKSGLPLGDCLRIISVEAREPVKSEFRFIVESLQLGIPITEAIGKMYERVPAQEVNFFATVIAIQSKAGGNLSEALSNLSRVLRDRKKMKAKINAMSMEAKASAGIIGSLPFIVSILVYLTSPDYIMLLFNTKTGNIILVIGLVYMSIGILVMKKMINFNF